MFSRRSFQTGLITALLAAKTTRSAAKAKNLTVVNAVSSLKNWYYASWDEGAKSFARSVGASYELIEHEGRLDDCIKRISDVHQRTHGDMILNIDLASKFDALAFAQVCHRARIFFVTHSFGQPNARPQDWNPYYVTHMISNHKLAGLQTAKALSTAMGGAGRVVALGGPPADLPANLRKAGLDQMISGNRACTLLDYQPANWDSSTAFEVTRLWLAKYRGQVNGIWAANDPMALGAIEALRVYRLIGKIPVTGIDGFPDAISSLRSEELTATVPWDAFYEGGTGSAIAFNSRRGFMDPAQEPEEHRVFSVAPEVLTKENVEQYLQSRKNDSSPAHWRDLWGRVATGPT